MKCLYITVQMKLMSSSLMSPADNDCRRRLKFKAASKNSTASCSQFYTLRNILHNPLTLRIKVLGWRSDGEASVGSNFRTLPRHVIVDEALERVDDIFDIRQEALLAQQVIEARVVDHRAHHVGANRVESDSLCRKIFAKTAHEADHTMLCSRVDGYTGRTIEAADRCGHKNWISKPS